MFNYFLSRYVMVPFSTFSFSLVKKFHWSAAFGGSFFFISFFYKFEYLGVFVLFASVCFCLSGSINPVVLSFFFIFFLFFWAESWKGPIFLYSMKRKKRIGFSTHPHLPSTSFLFSVHVNFPSARRSSFAGLLSGPNRAAGLVSRGPRPLADSVEVSAGDRASDWSC